MLEECERENLRINLEVRILTKSVEKTQGVMPVTCYYFGSLYFNRDLNSNKYLLLSAKLAPKSRIIAHNTFQ